ncbi:L-threonylcarbamoyladenylate synthase [Urechidicola vernalis]|uniref:L-threonylcarbamoyladenylate synthase n=1 Tax=Urechidicola vernalis TaxID=3075600 RepID=A0ABU2Y850_9FLAO|nr:L-threonylcarbamoyladenylate synthase [Urechidicola sp. P050]MDT0553829.1 L-threonylcarbamoyladenylate synthase [Urechidicola sp. P050]
MNEEFKKVVLFLNKGNTLLYPTDTVWGIGCDATDNNAVQRIFEIKKRPSSKSLILLVDSIEMLQDYVKITNEIHDFLANSTRPTTVIYTQPKGIAKNCIADDNTVAIRIVKDEFCQELIRRFGRPLVSTSANISGEPTPQSFQEIDKAILESVDYVVNLPNHSGSQLPSKIVKVLPSGEIEVLRA